MKRIAILLLFLIGSVLILFPIFFLKQNSAKKESLASGITFDSAYTNSEGDQYTNFSSWTHTVGPRPNRILIVGVTLKNENKNRPPKITAITFAGKPLNEFKQVINGKDKSIIMKLYYLKNPKKGANNIIIKTKEKAAISAGSFVLSGVNQETPPKTLFSSWQISKAENLNAEKGEVLFDFISAPHPLCILVPAQPQKILWISYGGKDGGILAGGASYKQINLSAESTAMSWKNDTCSDKNATEINWMYFVGKLLPAR